MGYIYTSYVEKFYYSEKIEDLSARAILYKEIIIMIKKTKYKVLYFFYITLKTIF